jgi:hypothetical protein
VASLTHQSTFFARYSSVKGLGSVDSIYDVVRKNIRPIGSMIEASLRRYAADSGQRLIM